MTFAHLHIHTEYSLREGLSSPGALFARARERGIRALAITDRNTLAGVPDFLKAAATCRSVRPVIGCEVSINDPERAGDGLEGFPLVLLAKNPEGYHNLIRIISLAQANGAATGRPFINNRTLRGLRNGLVCLSGGTNGFITQALLAGDQALAEKAANWYKTVFRGDFYLEAVRLSEKDERVLPELFALGQKLGIPIVATNDVRFADKGDGNALDRLCACFPKDGKRHGKPSPKMAFLKSGKQMSRLFPDHPEVISNTMGLLRKIRRFEIGHPVEVPAVSVPTIMDGRTRGWIGSDILEAGAHDSNGQLRDDRWFAAMCLLCQAAFDGARKHYGKKLSPELTARLRHELKAICRKEGLADYFLILRDLVRWAGENGVMVGPGRGSAPGSLTAYCLGITDIDPLTHGLLFERFYNPDYPGLPVIDLDIDEESRFRVMDYLQDTYGRERVAFVTAYGTLPAHLSEEDPFLKDVICRKGLNACSVILGQQDLTEYLPLGTWTHPESGKRYPVSQYASAHVGTAGVLELRFVGNSALSRIGRCVALIKERRGVTIRPGDIPADDPKTYDLFSRGDTTGVFHFEHPGMKPFLWALKPGRLHDLMVLDALYRPDSISCLRRLVDLKNGHGTIPATLGGVADILSETYGQTVWQEQVMTIAERVFGFPPEYADHLRRALCRGNQEDLDELFLVLNILAGDKGFRIGDFLPIWKEWTSLGKVIFNKSHAAAYALLGYRTAWLKAHYPKEFQEAG